MIEDKIRNSNLMTLLDLKGEQIVLSISTKNEKNVSRNHTLLKSANRKEPMLPSLSSCKIHTIFSLKLQGS